MQPIFNRIFLIRGSRVMIDFHLAELYAVPTSALNQAVKRNLKRFPPDFMFQLTKQEWNSLTTETVNSGSESMPGGLSQFVTAPLGGRNIKHLPYAFTEQGIAMLSSVLKSDRAIEMNIAIMRAFVIFRHHIAAYPELQEEIAALEKRINKKFKYVHEAIKFLMNEFAPVREIGFKQEGRK